MPGLLNRFGRRKSRAKRTESLSSVVSATSSLKEANAPRSSSRSLQHHDEETTRKVGRRWRPRRSVFTGMENDKVTISTEIKANTPPSTPQTDSQTPPLMISTPDSSATRPRSSTADESITTGSSPAYEDPIVQLAFEASDPFDPDHRNRIAREAADLDKQGNVFFEQGHYDRAFSLYRRALTLKRQSLHVSVEEEDDDDEDELDEEELDSKKSKASILASVATSINNMTYLKQRAGQASSDETMAAYLKSLQIKREILGPDHLSVGKTLNNIGSVFYLQQDYESALKAYQDAQYIMEQNLGAEHLDVGTVTSNIGDVYYMMDQIPQALQHYRKALDVRWKVLGQYDPKVIRLMEQIAALETGEQPMKENGDLSDSEQDEFEMEDRKRYADFQREVKILQDELEEDMKFFEMLERQLASDMLKHKNRIVWNIHDESDDEDEVHKETSEPLREIANNEGVEVLVNETRVSPVTVLKDAAEEEPASEIRASTFAVLKTAAEEEPSSETQFSSITVANDTTTEEEPANEAQATPVEVAKDGAEEEHVMEMKEAPVAEPEMEAQVSPVEATKETPVEEPAVQAQATLVVSVAVSEDETSTPSPRAKETETLVAAESETLVAEERSSRAASPPTVHEPVSEVSTTPPVIVPAQEEPRSDEAVEKSSEKSMSAAQVIPPREPIVTEASPPPSFLKKRRTRSISENESKNVVCSVKERLEKIRAERDKLIAAHQAERSSEDVTYRLAKLRAERAELKAAKEKKAAEDAERLARLREERAVRMAAQAAKAAEDARRLDRLRKARAARIAAQQVQPAPERVTPEKKPTPEFKRRHFMEPTTSSALKAATPDEVRQRQNSMDDCRTPELRKSSTAYMSHSRRNSSDAMEDLQPCAHSHKPVITAGN